MGKSWSFEELGFTRAWSQDSCSKIIGGVAGKMAEGSSAWFSVQFRALVRSPLVTEGA